MYVPTPPVPVPRVRPRTPERPTRPDCREGGEDPLWTGVAVVDGGVRTLVYLSLSPGTRPGVGTVLRPRGQSWVQDHVRKTYQGEGRTAVGRCGEERTPRLPLTVTLGGYAHPWGPPSSTVGRRLPTDSETRGGRRPVLGVPGRGGEVRPPLPGTRVPRLGHVPRRLPRRPPTRHLTLLVHPQRRWGPPRRPSRDCRPDAEGGDVEGQKTPLTSRDPRRTALGLSASIPSALP